MMPVGDSIVCQSPYLILWSPAPTQWRLHGCLLGQGTQRPRDAEWLGPAATWRAGWYSAACPWQSRCHVTVRSIRTRRQLEQTAGAVTGPTIGLRLPPSLPFNYAEVGLASPFSPMIVTPTSLSVLLPKHSIMEAGAGIFPVTDQGEVAYRVHGQLRGGLRTRHATQATAILSVDVGSTAFVLAAIAKPLQAAW